jgi:cysteinyl-tRNA synthetase
MTKALVEKGFAYVSADGVYYDISKFKNYGKLSRLDIKKIKSGARVSVDEYAKDAPQDFALMKRSTTEELKRGIYYDSEWGKVRPGWHIECSAMSMKYLGETIDIHTGGVDLIFPHHENEIAQSEAYTKKKFVNYWMHGEMLLVEGEKMSKSLGNIITLEDVVKKFSPEVIRYMFVSSHYRKKMNYTEKFGENARRNYEKLKETFNNLNLALKTTSVKKTKSDREFLRKLKGMRKKFIQAMDDNLNTPLALSTFHKLSKEINRYLEKNRDRKTLGEALKLFEEFSDVFGLRFKIEEGKLPDEIEELIKKREEARKKGEWETADIIRNQLKEKGIILEDTPKGVKWKRAR